MQMQQSYRFIDHDSSDFLLSYSDLQDNQVVQKLKKESNQLSQLSGYNSLNWRNQANTMGGNSNNMPKSISDSLKKEEMPIEKQSDDTAGQEKSKSQELDNEGRTTEKTAKFESGYNLAKDYQLVSDNDDDEIDNDESFEKENILQQQQMKEIQQMRDLHKRVIQRNQEQIIEELYKHQKDAVLKEKGIKDRKYEYDVPKIKEVSDSQIQNRYNYSVNNGQAINEQRQQKQDILRMLNTPPNLLKKQWNKIQKSIEDRLLDHEDGLPKNPNPIEKVVLNKDNQIETENGSQPLSDGEDVEEDKGLEDIDSEVILTKKIVKILEELKEVQNRDQKSIFHIALKQYCEKHHKMHDYIYTEDQQNKIKGFTCEVTIDDERFGPQLGRSKKDAKNLACMCAIARIMQSCPDLESIKYFQIFLEQARGKFIKLNDNITEAQHGTSATGDATSDLAVAQNIPENTNYREELSIFAHKNLHKQVNWENLFDPKERLWLAIVNVGNLTERGFGRSKKYAKNVASYKLLERCKSLQMKDEVIKNPKKLKARLQFALKLQETDELNIAIKPSQQLIETMNKKRGRQNLDKSNGSGNDEDEPNVGKKQKNQDIENYAQKRIKEVIKQLEEKYINYYKLESATVVTQYKMPNAQSGIDVFKQLQIYDSEIQASKSQYQSLQNMYNELQKELIKNDSSSFLKKLIPIGSYVNNCMNKYSTVMDVVAIYTPSQEHGDSFEANRFCDILYGEVQLAILNCKISDFFKMELIKGCVILIFTHNTSFKIRLIPNLILHENILNKRKYLHNYDNPLNSKVKPIVDPNENKYYGESLMHQVWLSQFKSQINEFESLLRIFRRVFKFQGFKIPIDIIDVVLVHVSHQFETSSFQDNMVSFVKFFAQNGLDDILSDNLQMVQISQLHFSQISKCSEFELKKVSEFFNNIYLKKQYENFIII